MLQKKQAGVIRQIMRKDDWVEAIVEYRMQKMYHECVDMRDIYIVDVMHGYFN